MKQFVKKIIVMILILATITGTINFLYLSHVSNYGTMGPHKKDSAYVVDVPSAIEICNFGNSHGYYGFDYEDYEKEYTCFNFSLPSQSMSYNYRILENYRDCIAPGATVYICVSYMTFFGAPESSGGDFASKNKRYYHFLDEKYIKNYDLNTAIFVKYIPALAESNIFRLLKTVFGIGGTKDDMWAGSTNSADALIHGKARYESLVASNIDGNGKRIYNDEEITALYEMIDLCKELQATPVLITTPYLSEYTAPVLENDPDFYDDFYGIIDQVQEETGVQYIDYAFDERFSDRYDLFFNTDHLNRKGARMFTKILFNETLD